MIAQAVAVLHAVSQRFGRSFEVSQHPVGGAAIRATGEPLPDETLAACRASDAVILGAVGDPDSMSRSRLTST